MWHESPEQEALALVRLQDVPHEPQSDRLSSEFSQPLESMPSQSSQPELQLAMWHESPEHEAVALARLQEVPHVWQSDRLSSEFSQPLESMPSQLPQPESQLAMWQEPPEHEALAWARLQDVPHEPQSLSVSSEVSQPSAS